MITTLCAYVLIGVFLILEGRLRQGQHAKSLERGQFDRGSTRFIGLAFFVTFILLILAPVLNHFNIGMMPYAGLVGSLGLILMLAGMGLRYWAAKTLGAFYTRTLLIQTEQRVVEQGPYRLLRHPGYVGDFLMFVGAGMATANWIAVIIIAVVMFSAYAYRIHVEEQMLLTTLGEPYRVYMQRSWRFIPWIY